MTQPKTAMEAFQAAYDAGFVAQGYAYDDQAAASVIEAWASERERELRDMLEKCRAQFQFTDPLAPFLPKPDPLAEAIREALPGSMPDHHAAAITTKVTQTLAKRGLVIVEKGDQA